MRVLLDTNIILDFLLEREPFLKDADDLFKVIVSRQVKGYVTATFYTYVRKQTKNLKCATEAVSSTLTALEVCPVNRSTLETALASTIKDFEDAVQLACATTQNLDAIVTRDTEGFAGASLPVLSITELLGRFR